MLTETVSLHDNFQFEAKLGLPFSGSGRQSTHGVETYFFVPSSLCINPGTLTRDEFFRRLKNYIRLDTPRVPLPLMDAPRGPLARIEDFLGSQEGGIGPDQLGVFEDLVKILCLTMQRALRAEAGKVTLTPLDRSAYGAAEYVTVCRSILGRYRALADMVRRKGGDASPAYAYGDEFLSIATTYYAFRMLDHVQNFREDAHCAEVAAALAAFLRQEQDYCSRVLGVAAPDPETGNELFVMRWSLLKKYMSSTLFLEMRERRDTEFWRQVVYSVAAGAAMIFATGIAFIWQGRYGSLSTPLFMALIISYIFKDRLKDFLRSSMSLGLRRFLSDRKRAIYRNFTLPVGVCKETFSFIPAESLPRDVAELRNKVHMVDVAKSFRSETVIRYRKEITLSRTAGRLASSGLGDRMVDITRMGVHEFLRYMDEPEEPLYVLDGEECRRVRGSKVYHVNMVRRLYGPEGAFCRRYRLVLDRNGIRRIERIR